MQRILIVEDEEHISRGLKLNLEAEDFSARIVADGKKAIEEILDPSQNLVWAPGNVGGSVGMMQNLSAEIRDGYIDARGAEIGYEQVSSFAAEAKLTWGSTSSARSGRARSSPGGGTSRCCSQEAASRYVLSSRNSS